MKALVEGATADGVMANLQRMRELQAEWKKIGAVPVTHTQEIRKAYQQYQEQFYDQVKIKDLKTSNNRLLNIRRKKQAGSSSGSQGCNNQELLRPRGARGHTGVGRSPDLEGSGPVFLTKELFVLCCDLSLRTSGWGNMTSSPSESHPRVRP